MDDRNCPLGEDCDLQIAWLAGAENQREHMRGRIERLETQLKFREAESDGLRERAEIAESERHFMRDALEEVKALVIGASFSRTRYPTAWRYYTGETVEVDE
jgi:hypothetical protein